LYRGRHAPRLAGCRPRRLRGRPPRLRGRPPTPAG